jgi:hypothetical protein
VIFRKAEYEAYLSSLGVSNVYVRCEKFSDLAPDSDILDGAVALLAAPPNSLSAVMDPVDLACSRGGGQSSANYCFLTRPLFLVLIAIFGNFENSSTRSI